MEKSRLEFSICEYEVRSIASPISATIELRRGWMTERVIGATDISLVPLRRRDRECGSGGPTSGGIAEQPSPDNSLPGSRDPVDRIPYRVGRVRQPVREEASERLVRDVGPRAFAEDAP